MWRKNNCRNLAIFSFLFFAHFGEISQPNKRGTVPNSNNCTFKVTVTGNNYLSVSQRSVWVTGSLAVTRQEGDRRGR
jgi:hypothetical protein